MDVNVFNQEFHLLEKLFHGISPIQKKRLEDILSFTEKLWYKNLDRYNDSKIRYVLIAEAPPWTEDDLPRYFYHKIESAFHKEIWKTFYSNTPIPSDDEEYYQMLARKGFLLIDTIPFSKKYESRHRKHRFYNEIILHSLSWWKNKLNHEKIVLTDNVKIALAFKLNGLAIISATNGKLELKNKKSILPSGKLIAADGTGYTKSSKLIEIFSLNL